TRSTTRRLEDSKTRRGTSRMNRLERLMHVATKYSRRIIGIMSGTSLDAIDVAMVRIQKHGINAKVRLEHFREYPYPPKIRAVVRELFDPKSSRVDDICRYDFILGEVFAAAVLRMLKDTKIKADSVDLVATAGQTIWHDPELILVEPDVDWIDHPIETRSTFAIGQSAVIAERTGIMTVGDLRVRDVAAGGQGAPLVPYFDWVLLRHKTRGRAIQNIGGIGNVTYIPPKASWEDVIAFDTGPGNMLIDELTWVATNGRQTYDVDGALAASGKVNEELLEYWMADPYFTRAPPKTTGRELFGAQFGARILAEATDVDIHDLIATATALTAESIARAYRDFVLPRGPIHEVLLAGGGAKNPTLVRMLRERMPKHRMLIYKASEAKEAMAMAMIANDSVVGLVTNVAGATGGKPTVLGKICL
ncbi:MAG TPA: anhydro-N-acetylmuramic acid kinase, partial [Thermoanaerobaculia bacterium]|nr:anhydro-N-acetylmuramic acid kinase [Thermoanaerobaculia bacterium]